MGKVRVTEYSNDTEVVVVTDKKGVEALKDAIKTLSIEVIRRESSNRGRSA